MSRSRKASSPGAPSDPVYAIASVRAPLLRRRPESSPALAAPLVEAPVESAVDRAERIRHLREQVQDGTYVPDSHEIARKILENGL